MTASSPILIGAMAKALEAGRESFNARFKQAKQFFPRLDSGIFVEHLRETVAPIVEAVAQKDPSKVSEVADKLYDLSLELCGRELLGSTSRYPVIRDGWRRILPALPHLVIGSPETLVGAVTNALYNLSLQPSARPPKWIDTMLWLGPNCPDVNWFLECGKVAAWRCGLAHYRKSALEACAKLDPAWIRTVLGVPAENRTPVEAILRQMQANPWLDPSRSGNGASRPELRLVAEVGGFRGFGGPFLNPPDVVRVEGAFVVFDTQGEWFLHVDAFGATFLRTDSTKMDRPSTTNPGFALDPQGRVAKGKLKAEFAELADASSSASDDATLVVTLPLSHKVFVVAETP